MFPRHRHEPCPCPPGYFPPPSFVSIPGPPGPPGGTGNAGADGTNGTNGTNGADGKPVEISAGSGTGLTGTVANAQQFSVSATLVQIMGVITVTTPFAAGTLTVQVVYTDEQGAAQTKTMLVVVTTAASATPFFWLINMTPGSLTSVNIVASALNTAVYDYEMFSGRVN